MLTVITSHSFLPSEPDVSFQLQSKRKKKAKKTYIYKDQIFFSEKYVEWRIWNTQSNSTLSSRTEKVVITWTETDLYWPL